MRARRPFSARIGIDPVRSVLLVSDVPRPLRNRLWSVLEARLWENVISSQRGIYRGVYVSDSENVDHFRFSRELWFEYFELPIDELPDTWGDVHKFIKKSFFGCPWNEVYDFLEFVVQSWPNRRDAEATRGHLNEVLESDGSGYRFIGETVAPVVTEEEVSAIEAALEATRGPIRTHLVTALSYLRGDDPARFRNSVKESISAVESWALLTTGRKKDSFERALATLEAQGHLHAALKGAFVKLYGYTSDGDGIRHAILDEAQVDDTDARFMLVACAAFLSFAKSKNVWPAGLKD